jgi:hypothetical protein
MKITGAPLSGSIRLQINTKVEKSNHLSILENIQSVLFPIFWFEVVSI